MQVDIKCVENELAPRWFLKFRTVNFTLYMIITTLLFSVYYTRQQQVSSKRDSKRIEHLREVMELEDTEFI